MEEQNLDPLSVCLRDEVVWIKEAKEIRLED